MAARIDFRAPAVSGQTHNRHEITYSSENTRETPESTARKTISRKVTPRCWQDINTKLVAKCWALNKERFLK